MMVAIHLESVPEHLRGYLDRYTNEVTTSLFIGSLNPTVIEELWKVILDNRDTGRAVLITPDNGESGFRIRQSTQEDWRIVDHNGWELPSRRFLGEGGTRFP